jgi:two-component SAPR family response regulator
MSGRELGERLTLLRPETKVIFISGYTEDAVGRHGLLPAEVEFLPKPLSPSKLAVIVREMLDR